MRGPAKITWVLLVCTLLAFGCSYHGAVDPHFYTGHPGRTDKIQASVAVAKPKHIKPVRAGGDLGDRYTIEVAGGLRAGVCKMFRETFREVINGTSCSEASRVDYIAYWDFEARPVLRNHWNGDMTITTKLNVDIVGAKTGREIATYDKTHSFLYQNPGSVQFLNFLTGLSCFTLSPITLPAIVELAGNHGETLLEENLRSDLGTIAEEIRRDKYKLKRIEMPESHRARVSPGDEKGPEQKIHSQYDNLIDCVVIVTTDDGFGSGFFVSKDGYIITNAHVVGEAGKVSIRQHQGRTLMAQVISTDHKRDLALLRAPLSGASYLSLAPLSAASQGTDLLAIGTPEGFGWSVSKGIVSGVRSTAGRTWIQTDTAINKGSSGGPLIIGKTGRVVGINTLKYPDDASEGLNFAIAAQEIPKAFPQIKRIQAQE